MRGVYTAGVLDAFQEHGAVFQAIYGVSAGACQAVSFLSGQRGRGYACAVDYLEDWRYCGMRSLLLTGNLFGAKMCYDTIPNQLYPFDYEAFARSPTRLYAVLTDLRTAKPVYRPLRDMRKDTIAVRASASLPMVSRAVWVDGRPTLDGGVVDSIPVQKAIQDGFARTVVVLTQHAGYEKPPTTKGRAAAFLRYPFHPALRGAMARRPQAYNRQLAALRRLEAEGKAFVIQPERPVGIARLEKDKGKLRALYQQGYADGQRLYPAMEQYLRGSRDSRAASST